MEYTWDDYDYLKDELKRQYTYLDEYLAMALTVEYLTKKHGASPKKINWKLYNEDTDTTEQQGQFEQGQGATDVGVSSDGSPHTGGED